VSIPTYVGVNHVYATLTMCTHSAHQKTLAASFKYKIVVDSLQTLTKHVLSSENTSQGFPMAEFTLLAVSTWN